MLSFGISRISETKYGNGKAKKTSMHDYAFHFQCPWRFVKKEDILLASFDIYNPYDESMEDDYWDWDVFGRDDQSSSVFDIKAAELVKEVLPLKITGIYQDDTNDLHIDFDKGIYFRTFINCSTKREYYRFIDFTSEESEHYVVFDTD